MSSRSKRGPDVLCHSLSSARCRVLHDSRASHNATDRKKATPMIITKRVYVVVPRSLIKIKIFEHKRDAEKYADKFATSDVRILELLESSNAQ
jgi:hypothetical protein